MSAIKVHSANIQRLVNKWGDLKLSGPVGGISGNTSGGPKADGFAPKTVLDERLFRRVQVFNGDLAKYRGWLFDLLVAIGTADRGLANELRRFMKEKAAYQVINPKFSIKDWDPDLHEVDTPFNLELHSKYSGELFGVLVQLTEGEAKSALTELAVNGGGVGADDGYQGLLLLQNRFDNQTTSSLLQLFCEVITPGA